jgi:hypothetical protein
MKLSNLLCIIPVYSFFQNLCQSGYAVYVDQSGEQFSGLILLDVTTKFDKVDDSFLDTLSSPDFYVTTDPQVDFCYY